MTKRYLLVSLLKEVCIALHYVYIAHFWWSNDGPFIFSIILNSSSCLLHEGCNKTQMYISISRSIKRRVCVSFLRSYSYSLNQRYLHRKTLKQTTRTIHFVYIYKWKIKSTLDGITCQNCISLICVIFTEMSLLILQNRNFRSL